MEYAKVNGLDAEVSRIELGTWSTRSCEECFNLLCRGFASSVTDFMILSFARSQRDVCPSF